jgi:hypothetical protein
MVGIRWTEGVAPAKQALLEKEYRKFKQEKNEKQLLEWFIEGEIDVVEMYEDTDTMEFKGFAPRVNGIIVSQKGDYLFPSVEEGFIEAFQCILAKKEKLKELVEEGKKC